MVKSFAAWASRVVSGLALTMVAAAAGVISYQHVEDLTLRLHGTLLAARLMPVGVDGLIAVGSMVLLDGGMLGWTCIGPGVAISLFANVESGIRYGWLAAVWAGIPAVSFALASFVLERWLARQTRPAKQTHPADAPHAVTETETVADTPREDTSQEAPRAEPAAPPIAPETETVTPPARHKRTREMTSEQLDEAAREFVAEVTAGELPSVRQIEKRVHVGRPRAQKIRTHLDALMNAPTIATIDALADAQTRVCETAGV